MSDDKTAAFMDEVGAALADIVAAMQDRTVSSDQIGSALADLAAAVESSSKSTSVEDITAAIRAARIDAPIVNVNVNPTPITVSPAKVEIIERASPSDYRLSVTYDNRHRITEAVIRRIK